MRCWRLSYWDPAPSMLAGHWIRDRYGPLLSHRNQLPQGSLLTQP
jgi:hypothetical protein